MKTLYININGIVIRNSEDVYVVGKPEDAIVNKFYYELGKEILKSVGGSVGKGINKKSIVTDFMDRNKESYDAIWKEWEAVKDKLLGENPTGPHKVTLPAEYINWLNNNSQTAYSEIAKFLHDKGGVVEISIDKIYRNAIGIIVNSIEPIECKECKQFVVNDSCVTDDSAISLAIMEKLRGIVFVPYDGIICSRCGKFPCECKQESVCPQCGKSHCECITEPPICPKCGNNPCECAVNIFFDKDINEVLYETINDSLGVSSGEYTLESNLESDLGVDLLDRYEIMSRCEQNLGVTISKSDVNKLETVGDLFMCIYRYRLLL